MPAGKSGRGGRALTAVQIAGDVQSAGETLKDLPLRNATASRTPAEEVRRWTYLLRSRARWKDDPYARSQLQAEAAQSLKRLGLRGAALSRLAQHKLLRVRVPYEKEEACWEGRVFPWEYVLAAATREHRLLLGDGERPRPLTVMRELHAVQPARPRVDWDTLAELRVLFVNTLPPELREGWTVSRELEVLRTVMPKEARPVEVLNYPSLGQLRDKLDEFKPHLLHIAGMDSHQSLRELRAIRGDAAEVLLVDTPDLTAKLEPQRLDEVLGDTKRMVDGLLMRGAGGLPQLVRAQAFARLMAQAKWHPVLTVLNVWNSAARIAPMLIAEGATLAALGFQDAFDDSLAVYALARFYRMACDCDLNLPEAFQQMWTEVRDLDESVDATGVTLWLSSVADALQQGRAAVTFTPPPPAPDVRCEIVPEVELNYALLHNGQPLFKRFVLASDAPGPDQQVDVEVEVHMGPEVARYQRRVVLLRARERLTESIRVPLTADVARSVHEAINTSLHVRVRQGDKVLYHDSHQLRLLPVDQWRDNRRDGRWLPSFVLPRDPAVMDAISQARRYNRVLRDDPNAGFEGYQCVASAAPTEADEESLRGVDGQAQAIWAALAHDWQLGYINPPPSYSSELDSQRLRTPSMVRAAGAGTCIDLALLFAACLELVDIYPVIFLLEGHALPGWWRHWSYRDEFLAMSADDYNEVVEADASASTAANAQVVSWQAGRASWAEIRRYIRERKLVPIETVRLTEHCGFIEAIEAGVEALKTRADFDAVLDIVTARQAQVTPLPMLKD
jgi:hypothetical protein